MNKVLEQFVKIAKENLDVTVTVISESAQNSFDNSWGCILKYDDSEEFFINHSEVEFAVTYSYGLESVIFSHLRLLNADKLKELE